MRTVEFRAWDKPKKEWVHEYVYLRPNGTIWEKEYEGYLDPTNRYEVVLYTGSRDRAGKKIFGGDIIRWRDGHISRVIWDSCNACFRRDDRGASWHLQNEWYAAEVIGNIYENPELLEGKQ